MARPLTHRQLEVLELIAKGLTNTEIGAVLGISLSTVKTHVSAVIETLGAGNRTEAAGMLAELELGQRAPQIAADEAVPGFGERPALAMLPFENLGDAGESDWFTRGVLSDLTRLAGHVRWFPVIQVDSILRSTGATDRPATLGARYLIDGSVLRERDRITVTVRSRDPETGENIWATRLEGPADGLDTLQAELVERIVRELEPAVLRLEHVRAERDRADGIAVWDLCKRGEHGVDRETALDYERAVRQFEEAIALDPGSSRPWSGLALAHGAAVYLGLVDDLRKTSKRAQLAAHRALELAPDGFESQLSLGRCLALSLEDEAAVPYLEGALERDPSSTLAAGTLAGALRRRGHAEAAIPLYERSIRLSPQGPRVHHVYGGLSLARLSVGDFEAALRCARRAVAGDPASGQGKALDFYPVIPASLALLGRIDEAKAAWAAAGAHASRSRLRHSARFTGERLEALVEGLRLAGWDGRFD
jgi:TolB-like protein/DNA-binding CsgD family transcriptional regulator/Tfp pilus assembly protein PilF